MTSLAQLHPHSNTEAKQTVQTGETQRWFLQSISHPSIDHQEPSDCHRSLSGGKKQNRMEEGDKGVGFQDIGALWRPAVWAPF